ncbi:MAG: hypothetical protein Q6364_07810 [Candidatus Hermodarchaeota archaeon]|nr:hypothetical protein [Candidatus Hermodarchaeota archaeon]
MSIDRSKDSYDLIMSLLSLSEIQRRVLISLAHIYPKAASGKQLITLIGYSGKAKSLYRGPLERLEMEELILVDRLTPRLHSIRVNHLHPLIEFLLELIQAHGNATMELYTQALEDGKSVDEEE